MDLESKKTELIERLGVAVEKEEKLAPLAARIFATLLLTDKDGITFDQLVHDLNASKSTVSTHLDTLQAVGRITYFTKPGDRKRYFVINKKRFFHVIDELVELWEFKLQITGEIIQYKEKYNSIHAKNGDEPFNVEFQKDFVVFLEEAITSINKLKNKISEKYNESNI